MENIMRTQTTLVKRGMICRHQRRPGGSHLAGRRRRRNGFGGTAPRGGSANNSETWIDNAFARLRAASMTRAKHLQLGNAFVGPADPPTKLAVDILHDDHIRVDIGLVVRVKFSGREFVQHGWTLRNDGG